MKKFHIILLFAIGTGICAEIDVKDTDLDQACEHAKAEFLKDHPRWHEAAIVVDTENSTEA